MPTYNFRKSLSNDQIGSTDNFAELFNPYINGFFNGAMTVAAFSSQVKTVLGELEDEKISELYPYSNGDFRDFLRRLRAERPDLIGYLWLFDNAGSSIGYTGLLVKKKLFDRPGRWDFATIDYNDLNIFEKIQTEVDVWLRNNEALWQTGIGGTETMLCVMRAYASESTGTKIIYDRARDRFLTPAVLMREYPSNLIGRFEWSPENNYVEFSPSEEYFRAALSRLQNHSYDVTAALGRGKVLVRKRPTGLVHPKEAEPYLYGVELEVSTDATVPQIMDSQKEVFMICKQDSSITGSKTNAIELVTMPQCLRRHRLHWAKFMGKHYDKDSDSFPMFDVTNRTENGMHVHVDRQAFADESHLKRFTFFFLDPLNKDFITAVAERNSNTMERWAAIPTRGGYNTRRKWYDQVVSACLNRGKYCAVNLSKSRTAEVRIFKGLFSYPTVMKNLEFVDAVMHYTRDFNLLALGLPTFIQYLNSQPRGRYKALRRFITKIDIETMIENYKTKSVFEGARSPQEAIQIIAKKNIPESRDLAASLNVMFGGRKLFHWDNKNKTISLTNKDKAVLHTLEGEFLKPFTTGVVAA